MTENQKTNSNLLPFLKTDALPPPVVCPDCGRPVSSFFAHIGVDCLGSEPERVAAGLLKPVEFLDDPAHSAKAYEDQLPKYSDRGFILVRIHDITEPGQTRRVWEYDVIDYDGSVFWINEGTGIDYWLEEQIEFSRPGTYLIEGITGRYIRGDGYSTDDDEDWEYETITRLGTLRSLWYDLKQRAKFYWERYKTRRMAKRILDNHWPD